MILLLLLMNIRFCSLFHSILLILLFETVYYSRNTSCLGTIICYSGSKPKHTCSSMRIAMAGIWNRSVTSRSKHALPDLPVSKKKIQKIRLV